MLSGLQHSQWRKCCLCLLHLVSSRIFMTYNFPCRSNERLWYKWKKDICVFIRPLSLCCSYIVHCTFSSRSRLMKKLVSKYDKQIFFILSSRFSIQRISLFTVNKIDMKICCDLPTVWTLRVTEHEFWINETKYKVFFIFKNKTVCNCLPSGLQF